MRRDQVLRGHAWLFGDDVGTDAMIPARYLSSAEPETWAEHAMEGLVPNFSRQIKVGDIIVAGENFGCGSAREHAPLALKEAGVSGVIARSVARIFYRNAINNGLPVLECREAVELIQAGDRVEIDLAKGVIRDLDQGKEFSFVPLPEFLLTILNAGGIIPFYQKKMPSQ